MTIRDDRGMGRREPPPVPTKATRTVYADYFAPDAVLYDCPQCNRSHFVTVGGCPDEKQAEHETALAGN